MAATSSRYFEARRIGVSYDRVTALSEVSIAFDAGGIVALIGANGAGKSTFLRATSGLVALAGGEIWFDGQRLDRIPAAARVAMGIAMVPEGRRVFPLMSVRDNLLMGAHVRRDRGVARDLDVMLDRFPRLRERLRQAAGTLSGGEQEMLVIARALMSRPRLLLLDEPSLGLAPIVVRDIARLIVEIRRDAGTSIVLVEQNSRMALRISQYAYVLETGRIGLEGASQDLLNEERVRELYLGG
ncbi:MAG: ABC transporter ATP-binding protein [Rhodobacteraceae bacterium]|nr:ABC transporter ATP-binding protein [Paracoccaceae bacterium]